jgi:hypothetical protein
MMIKTSRDNLTENLPLYLGVDMPCVAAVETLGENVAHRLAT